MKNSKKIFSCVMALLLATSVTACGSNKENANANDTTTAAQTTTTAATVAINTETLKEDEAEVLNDISSMLQDVELENKTIKWLSFYDLNPDTTGKSKDVGLEMFEKKYGGKVVWYPTTWSSRYDDLSIKVLGGEGIDFFPGDDTSNFPNGIVNGMFQPINDYIDFNSPIWQQVETAMNIYSFNGKYYEFVYDVIAECFVLYNKETIETNGLDDPYELWKSGKWNWDTFKNMLRDFVDEDADQWGLDGFWAEKALQLSAGVPLISTDSSGSLICNINNSTVEKAMNYMYGLYTDGLVFPREQFGYVEQPSFMGDGRQLFYLCGVWVVQGAPETWAIKVDPEDLMMVPVPSPADSVPYQAATLSGYALCKGAQNPLGVSLLTECKILAGMDEGTMAISDRKALDDNKWSEELLQAYKDINEMARINPIVDLSAGASKDIKELTSDGGDTVGIRAALHGTDWASNREALADTLILLVDEVDKAIKAKQAE